MLNVIRCLSFSRLYSGQEQNRMTSLTVQLSNRGNVHVERGGVGHHSLLCIPGALGTALTDYSPQLLHFANHKFNITSFDPLGYGRSQSIRRSFQTDPIHFLKQDGYDGYKLMNQFDIKTFSVLGWSDGGIAAIFLAACFPKVVNKLVIWGANAFVSEEDIKLFERTRDIKNWSPRMRESLESVYGRELGPLWSEWMDSMIHILREKDGNICKDMLSSIKAPTLILHGDKDPLVPAFHPLYLKENINDSFLYRFPDGKHNIHLKYSKEFNSIVEEFLLN